MVQMYVPALFHLSIIINKGTMKNKLTFLTL